MTSTELIEAVERVLGELASLYIGGASEADLYEAALMTIAVGAAQDAGGVVMMTNDSQTPTAILHFRRSPGNLWLGQFSYGRVSFGGVGAELEVHLGVYVVGRSGVAHECDVALIDHDEAERSRRGAVHPRSQGLVASIEAKHYVVSPGIGVGRGFVGLSTELGQKKCALSFPAKGSSSLATLIANRPSECFDELIPESAAARRLRSHLDQMIRNWLA